MFFNFLEEECVRRSLTSVGKLFPLLLWIIEMQITSVYLPNPSPNIPALTPQGYKYLSIIFGRVNFSLRGLFSIQGDAQLSDWQRQKNTNLTLRQNSPKSSVLFSTFPLMEMPEPDTGGAVIIRPGRESDTRRLFEWKARRK